MVSVIIPNFNHSQYLGSRIESVLDQEYSDFELIILDDASTDNSLDIINNYRNHPKVAHIEVNKRNSGSPFKQWQKGIKQARGEYIWIAESDDIADRNFLLKTVRVLDEYPKCGLVQVASMIIDEEGKEQGLYEYNDSRFKDGFIVEGMTECKNSLLHKNIIPNASAVLFRKRAISEGNDLIGEYKINGDWLFWASILLKWDLAFIPEALNYFRKHGQTARSSTYNNGIALLEEVKVKLFLAKMLSLNRSEEKNLAYNLCYKWLYAVFFQKRRVPIRTHKEIYRLVAHLYPALYLAIGKTALAFGFQKIRNEI